MHWHLRNRHESQAFEATRRVGRGDSDAMVALLFLKREEEDSGLVSGGREEGEVGAPNQSP
jgi:hypothetical protein